jgi:hypothetical protein
MFSFFKQKPTIDERDKLKLLEIENEMLRQRLKDSVVVVDPGIDDPIPTDEDSRQAYVERYASFHDDFLEKKLKHMIAQVREQLDGFGWDGLPYDTLPQGMSRIERDAFFRGTSNALRLLLEYGEQMRSERASYNE